MLIEDTPPTLEEINGTIRAARDSVWVISDSLQKLENGYSPTSEIKSNIERNVGHLKHVTSSTHVLNSGEDITDLLAAITNGEAKLEENIWNV